MSSSPESSRETTLHELLDAFAAESGNNGGGERPCAVCRLVARSVERDIRTFFAEFVNDPKTREGWRRARGFCAEHTPLLASLGDALAVAILYTDLARQIQETWRSGREGRRGFRLGRGGRANLPSAPCPACAALRESGARYASALAAGLESEAVWTAFEASAGLCTAHAEQVMEAGKPAVAARLREAETARLAALQAELEEIIRKNDYRFRGEAWGAEKDAWLRALQKLIRPRT